jgi:hypothetical protein
VIVRPFGNATADIRVVSSVPMSRAALTLAALLACTPHVEPPAPAQPAVEPPAEAPAAPPTTTWTTLDITRKCAVKIADTPAALGEPVKWAPCGHGPPGCRELVDEPGDEVELRGFAHGEHVTVVASQRGADPGVRHVLAPRDGLPFFAVESPSNDDCGPAHAHLSEDGGVIEIQFDRRDGDPSFAYLRGPLRDDPAWREIAAVLPRGEIRYRYTQTVTSVGGRVVIEPKNGPLRWYDAATRQWLEVPGSGDGAACCTRGHGDFVTFLFTNWSVRHAIAARLDEPAQRLKRGEADGLGRIAIDGARTVWLEGKQRVAESRYEYERVELWTAELSQNLSLESAELVTVLPLRRLPDLTLGGGVVAFPLEDRGNSHAVVLLASRQLRVLRAPPDMAIERLLWVAADEIAVQIGPGTMAEAPSKVQRIPLAALRALPPGG